MSSLVQPWGGTEAATVCVLNIALRAARHSGVLERGSLSPHVTPFICATRIHSLGLQRRTADSYHDYYIRSPTRHPPGEGLQVANGLLIVKATCECIV